MTESAWALFSSGVVPVWAMVWLMEGRSMSREDFDNWKQKLRAHQQKISKTLGGLIEGVAAKTPDLETTKRTMADYGERLSKMERQQENAMLGLQKRVDGLESSMQSMRIEVNRRLTTAPVARPAAARMAPPETPEKGPTTRSKAKTPAKASPTPKRSTKRARYDDPDVEEPEPRSNIMSVVEGLDADFDDR